MERTSGAWCNICRWSGSAFRGRHHVESAGCPRCGSIARDRFLIWCLTSRMGQQEGARVLETSPRLGAEYREMMRHWYRYQASDFDLSAHRADISIDLQDIALPAASVDVVLTPHVLEHVPDTDRALSEIHRILTPAGRMYLQVPLQQGRTRRPDHPEYHDDDTLVHWRFGWDLTAQLRAAGFATTVLVPDEFVALVHHRVAMPPVVSAEFDLPDLLKNTSSGDLTCVAPQAMSSVMGFTPGYQFATWECLRRSRFSPTWAVRRG